MDEACDRFEAAWRTGDRPRIEDFLGGTTDSDRPVLLRHLLSRRARLPQRSRGVSRAVGVSMSVPRARRPDRLGLRRVRPTVQGRSRGGPGDHRRPTGRDGPRSGGATSPPPDDFPNIPGSEILSELGRGGMGVVYKARQIRLNRLCALKMLLPGQHDGAEFRARFLAEAETIARLRHPNIVQIYGLGDHDGRPYFEMEYIEGGSLARRLDGTPWPPEPAARMVAVLARAIGEAHRLGIVHRDLKPANVLLMDDETPKIVDFGLAKTLEADSNLTQSGVFVGTPSYAAPEQVEGLTEDGRPGRRHLRAGGDLLSDADRPPPLPGGDGPPDAGTGQDGRPGAAVAAAAGPVPGCGDDLPEVPAEGPAAALRRCRGAGRGSGPFLDRAGDPGPADRGRGARAEVDPAPAGGGPAVRGGGGGHRPGLHPGLLAMARAEAKAAAAAAANDEAQAGAPRRVRETGRAHVPPGAGPV